jgi:hypothetical protein
MKKYLLIAALFAPVVFIACDKTYTKVANYQLAGPDMAYLKIVHVSPSFRQLFNNNPDTFNVYLNTTKLTAPALSFNSIYPGTSINTYMAVTPGTSQIRFSLPGTVNPDSLTLYTIPKTLVAGKSYTLFITDSIMSARDSSRLLVEDAFTTPATGYVNFRFVNAVVNDTAGKTVDVFSYARNANIFSKIKPDSATTFLSFGFNAGVADTLYVRRTGTNQVFSKVLVSPANQRTYTLVYKGDGNLSTGTKARTLIGFVH